MLKVYFLLAWPNKNPSAVFAASLQLDAYFRCLLYSYSLLTYVVLMDMMGIMLITKNKLFSMQCYYALLEFASINHSHTFFYNFVLMDWYDTDKNAALT